MPTVHAQPSRTPDALRTRSACPTTVDGAPTGARPVEPLSGRFLAPLMIGSTLNPINSSLIATALVPIGQAFGVTGGRTAILIAALYLASAVAQPTMGRLAESFGPRRVFVAGSALVLAGGVLGTAAGDLTALLVSRVLLGVGTAAAYPTAVLMIRRYAGDKSPGAALGGLSISANIAVVLGLPLGGLLVGLTGWRATFLINVPLSLVAIGTALVWLPRDQRGAPRSLRSGLQSLDVPGIVLFGATLSALLVFLMSLREPAWWAGALALVLAAALVAWERRATGPFLDVRSLVRNGALTLTYLRTGAVMFGSYCVMYGATQWLQEPRGLDATTTGLLLLPMTATAALISGPIARRNLVRTPLLLATLGSLVVAAGFLVLQTSSPLLLILLLTTVLGLTLGLAGIGNQAALYAQARPEQIATAAGLQRTATYLGAIGSSSLISFAYADGVTDASLRTIACTLLAVAGLTAVMVLADRGLPRRLVPGGGHTG